MRSGGGVEERVEGGEKEAAGWRRRAAVVEGIGGGGLDVMRCDANWRSIQAAVVQSRDVVTRSGKQLCSRGVLRVDGRTHSLLVASGKLDAQPSAFSQLAARHARLVMISPNHDSALFIGQGR